MIAYKDALDGGMLDTYTNALDNGLLEHYERALEEGDIKPTEDDIENIYPFTMSHYKELKTACRRRPDYFVYKQYHDNIRTEQKIIELENQIEGLKKGRAEYREKYNALKAKIEG